MHESKPFNVLHVIDHARDGGAQSLLAGLLRETPEQIVQGVAILGTKGFYSELFDQHAAATCYFERAKWSLRPIADLKKFCTVFRPDIMHCHLHKSLVIGSLVATRLDIPLVLHEHSQLACLSKWRGSGIYRHFFRRALQKTQALVVPTEYLRRGYLNSFGDDLAPDKIHVVANGILLSAFETAWPGPSLRREIGVAESSLLVVMVGRMEPPKNWLAFLEAIRKLAIPGQDVHGVAVGDGPQRARLEQWAQKHKVPVFFLGRRTDVPRIFTQCDLSVLLSDSESFGLVVLESMAAGCPVVSNDLPGPRQIIIDGDTGVLLPKNAATTVVAETIERILTCPGRKAHLGTRGRLRAQQFSLACTIKRLATIYGNVADQHRNK